MLLHKINTSIGKRKTAVAKVFIKEGTGVITINKKLSNEYFVNFHEEYQLINKPFVILNILNKYDIEVNVKGGGLKAQLSAIILALSKSLSKENINYRQILKKHLLLRSDSRIKERRKYGLKKARKASQYSKR